MSFWDLFKRKEDREIPATDESPKQIDLTDLDPVDIAEDLRGGPLIRESDGKVRIFGKYTEAEISDMMARAGIIARLEDKGFKKFKIDLQYLSDLDQRIFVKLGKEILIHLRLKLSHFRFRLHPGAPQKKLLYIDWLMTRNPRAKKIRPDRLFPGQEAPGLGIFIQIKDFITMLATGVDAQGAFNIPEYFHDAVLFRHDFNFYDPSREAFFRALIRDLRRHGAREITVALSEERVIGVHEEIVTWTPGEMISATDPRLREMLWSKDYYDRVNRALGRYKFKMIE